MPYFFLFFVIIFNRFRKPVYSNSPVIFKCFAINFIFIFNPTWFLPDWYWKCPSYWCFRLLLIFIWSRRNYIFGIKLIHIFLLNINNVLISHWNLICCFFRIIRVKNIFVKCLWSWYFRLKSRTSWIGELCSEEHFPFARWHHEIGNKFLWILV